jgi:hypothetical protein
MKPWQITRAFQLALFNILEANADVLSLWTLCLYTGNPALSVDMVKADLAQPTFAGYVPFALVPPALEVNANGDVLITWPSGLFQASGAVSPQQIATGGFITATISASDTLLMAGALLTPKGFSGATDAVTLIPQTIIPNAAIYGGLAAQV